MSLLSRLSRHADLVGRMSETVGADLAAALGSERLQPEAYRAAVLRCTSCAGADDCPDWMEHHQGQAEAPSYCRNRDLFKALTA